VAIALDASWKPLVRANASAKPMATISPTCISHPLTRRHHSEGRGYRLGNIARTHGEQSRIAGCVIPKSLDTLRSGDLPTADTADA
ncbi:MAG: hypothetical protein ACR2JI_06880, partial [Mycobacterium sp.]